MKSLKHQNKLFHDEWQSDLNTNQLAIQILKKKQLFYFHNQLMVNYLFDFI